MKNLLLILFFLLASWSNNMAIAMTIKIPYSTSQNINSLPKNTKKAFIKTFSNKNIGKILTHKKKLREILENILFSIGIVSMLGLAISIVFLIIWLGVFPFGGLGISIWWLLGSVVFWGGLLFLLIALGIVRGH